MDACTGWSWAVILGVAFGSFFLGMILMSCCSCSAYNTGYEDAIADHQFSEEV